MGLMLSVLVMCVGVLEAISCVQHIRESYLPLEFKRRKRRMVVDLGTGTVRHVDISWPGDVPRGSHVIRRRSGLMSPHSSFDFPDDETPRRTSVHFDPVQLERAVADILLEEDTMEESEESSTSPPIVESRLEFSTRFTTESAAVPINELRQETELLPGNRPSLASRPEADIVDPKTQVDRPPNVLLAESDSVAFSEKISAERFISPVKESIPKHEFIPSGSDSTSSLSSLSTRTPQSFQTRERPKNSLENHVSQPDFDQQNKATISFGTAISESESCVIVSRDGNESTDKLGISSSPQEIPSQDSPLMSPVTSETEGIISSVTEISESVSTDSLLLDESTDKSEEDIPEDQSLNRAPVDRLESIEELIKSANSLIICQDSKPETPSVSEVQNTAGETKLIDLVETDNESVAISSVSNKSTLEPDETDVLSKPNLPVDTEPILVPNDSEVEDSDNSVDSVVHAPFEKNATSDELESNKGNSEHACPVSPETPNSVPVILDLPSENTESLLPKCLADEAATCEPPSEAMKSSSASVSRLNLSQMKGESVSAEGSSHESTVSLESAEASSNASAESQVEPSLEESIIPEQKTENYTELQSVSANDIDECMVEMDVPACNIENEDINGGTKQDVSEATNIFKDNDSVPPDVSYPSNAAANEVAESSLPSADNKTVDIVPPHYMNESNFGKCERLPSSPIYLHLSDKESHSAPKGVSPTAPDHPQSESCVAFSESEESQKSDGLNAKEPCLQSAESKDAGSRMCITSAAPIETNDKVKQNSMLDSKHAASSFNNTEKDAHVIDEHLIKSSNIRSMTAVGSEGSSALNGSYQQPDETRETIISCIEHERNVKENDIVQRKSLIETENIVISTHKIESDEHVSSQQATQSDLTHSATILECERGSNVLQDKISSVQSPILPGDGKMVEKDGYVEPETGDEHRIEEGGNNALTNQVLVEKPLLPSGTLPVMTNEESIASALESTEDSRDLGASYDINEPNTSRDKKVTPVVPVQRNDQVQVGDTYGNVAGNDIRTYTSSERDDGLKKSNENPSPTDRSNASEVQQEMKRVSPIEESGEIVKVAPSAPAEPQEMEDIQVPAADTSPNKAFWVRD